MRRMRFFDCVVRSSVVALLLISPAVDAADSDAGELIVFVRPGASEVARSFQSSHLPRISAVAASLQVPVRVVDVDGE